jgi:hypothetical protein
MAQFIGFPTKRPEIQIFHRRQATTGRADLPVCQTTQIQISPDRQGHPALLNFAVSPTSIPFEGGQSCVSGTHTHSTVLAE